VLFVWDAHLVELVFGLIAAKGCSAHLHGKRRTGGGVRGWHYCERWNTCQYC